MPQNADRKATKSIFVARRWYFSICPTPPLLRPEEWGWILHDGKYKIKWFKENVAPPSLDDIIVKHNDEDEDYGDSNDDHDSMMI